MSINSIFRARLVEAVRACRPELPVKLIAHKAGYSKGYLERLMSGRKSNPTLQTVESLAAATNVSVAWLLGLDSALSGENIPG